jgi:hypothetical protein
MNEQIKNAPEKIYLVVGDPFDLQQEEDFKYLDDVIWSSQRTFTTDLEYVSSSLLKEKDEQIKEIKEMLEILMKDTIGNNLLPKAPKTAIIKKAQYILQKHNSITK